MKIVCHVFKLRKQVSKMIIFESVWTTLITSIVFKAAGAVAKLGLSLKAN